MYTGVQQDLRPLTGQSWRIVTLAYGRSLMDWPMSRPLSESDWTKSLDKKHLLTMQCIFQCLDCFFNIQHIIILYAYFQQISNINQENTIFAYITDSLITVSCQTANLGDWLKCFVFDCLRQKNVFLMYCHNTHYQACHLTRDTCDISVWQYIWLPGSGDWLYRWPLYTGDTFCRARTTIYGSCCLFKYISVQDGSSSLSCMNQYLATDNGGYLIEIVFMH